MSIDAMKAVWDHSEATGAARLILLAMADEAHSSGALTAYARSTSYLAKKARVSLRTAKRAIDELEAIGEVRVLSKGTGRDRSDYQIVLPGLGDEGCQIDTPQVAERHPRGDTTTPLGCPDDTPITPVSPVGVPVPARAAGRGSPSAIDPERCSLDDAVAIWPRPGEKAHRLKGRWRTAIDKAGGRIDLAIAVNALALAWAGESDADRRFAPSLKTWLDEERYREGANQQGPRRPLASPAVAAGPSPQALAFAAEQERAARRASADA